MDKVSVPKRTTTDEELRLDAARHPERIYREHVVAAREIAAAEYRAEVRRMMALDMLEDGEEL